MKCVYLPKKISALIFDIDNTLYSNKDYAHEQVDVQVRAFARLKHITAEEARLMVQTERDMWAQAHNGDQITLANIMIKFGISIDQIIEWRNKLIKPEQYLKNDDKLIREIGELATKYKLIAITNNPVSTGRRNLDAIGIGSFFEHVIGLDTTGLSKPAPAPFIKAFEMLGVPSDEIVSIGDRYAVDIATPVALGMGGILVTGPEDIYALMKEKIL